MDPHIPLTDQPCLFEKYCFWGGHVGAKGQVCEPAGLETGAWELTEGAEAADPFLDKKEVAQKEEGEGPPHIRRGRLTEFQGEDDGRPSNHRTRRLP